MSLAQERPTEGETRLDRALQAVVIAVTDEHTVAKARRAARAMADAIGFETAAAAEIATAVSELAHNLRAHTLRGGTITLVVRREDGSVGIQVVAEDDGPGIPDVATALENGFSTSGSLGEGLSAVGRMMGEMEIRSAAGVGTRVLARKWRTCP